MNDIPLIAQDGDLAAWLGDPQNDGQVVQTKLRPSDRVIARVTDGIYRQPASALRELISNAWDADAQNVTILTDAPRFSRIYVRDDGAGMSHRTLARLMHNIGGSAKRRDEGQELGLASDEDPELTPGGRKIIGKIGIGLFSVSQLARRFELITKTKGSDYRLIAEIRLHQYSEDSDVPAENDDEFIAGDVYIRREQTTDLNAHGTDIIMDDIKPRVRDILRSADRWQAVAERDEAFAQGDLDTWASLRVEKPVYHAGYAGMNVAASAVTTLAVPSNLPWTSDTAPEARMARLIEAVEGEFTRRDRPDLANTLDSYLEMIWSLGLSAPVPYVDCHPFDLTGKENIKFYWITPGRGRGHELKVAENTTVRKAAKEQIEGAPALREGLDPVGSFNVDIDGLTLKRPIRFQHRQSDPRGLEHAVMFIGEFCPDLASVASVQRGGGLGLEGYLFWTGRVVPKENNGVLVRIRGASGALFDPTFFKYQVSEQTRLRQITSEIFVQKGLDAALNIDRESFNFAHPHVQLTTMWLHNALRQLTNRLKDIGQRLRQSRQGADATQQQGAVIERAEKVWRSRQGSSSPPPDVRFTRDPDEINRYRSQGSMVFSPIQSQSRTTSDAAREAQVSALVKVLAAYGLLEDRTYAEQQEIINAIIDIFGGSA
ncbi:hypothetical protein LCGC14_0324920 [marine sediment metagenome]|uniref:Histidine kinase/HSP90-like ATPase domain-containing protein n=1 Tax=marine sediment metagenome TaxID=412755 RepID=A0A0F9W5I5_9ZZZZ